MKNIAVVTVLFLLAGCATTQELETVNIILDYLNASR
jgi:outer membrane murein-binding lipoprotein Lpp